jgi:AcrR family transcriptional regulator
MRELTHLRQRFPEDPTDGRGRVLQAGAELFTRHGYAATSTDAIAAAAGLKPAALYRLFASKEDILYTFLEAVYEGFLEDMQDAVELAEGPAERLACLAWAHTWIQLSLRTIPRAHIETMFSAAQLLSSVSAERADRLRALGRAHVGHCRAIIEDGSRQGIFSVPDARSAALAITTMCEYTPLWFRPTGPLTALEICDRHALYALRVVQADIDDLASFAQRATRRDAAAADGARTSPR